MPLLGIYPREMKTYIYIKTCTQITIAVSFIIAKTGNNPNDYQRAMDKQMWFFYTKDYFSVIKRNELLIYVTIWMNH